LFSASEEALTIARREDRAFQEMLAAAVEHLMPVLGIENPDNPLRTEKLPKLTVAQDEWQETVVRLIQAARIVVVYTDRPTAGVAAELKLVVNEGRAADTLLVLEADETELLWRGSPSEDAFDKFVKQPGAQISGAWSQWLERFPTVLNWSSSNPDPKAFAEAIEAITSRSGEGHFSGSAPIPRSIVPTGPGAVRANEEMMERSSMRSCISALVSIVQLSEGCIARLSGALWWMQFACAPPCFWNSAASRLSICGCSGTVKRIASVPLNCGIVLASCR
jgi:hypothetical protein